MTDPTLDTEKKENSLLVVRVMAPQMVEMKVEMVPLCGFAMAVHCMREEGKTKK
jgi:hypothetical protein